MERRRFLLVPLPVELAPWIVALAEERLHALPVAGHTLTVETLVEIGLSAAWQTLFSEAYSHCHTEGMRLCWLQGKARDAMYEVIQNACSAVRSAA